MDQEKPATDKSSTPKSPDKSKAGRNAQGKYKSFLKVVTGKGRGRKIMALESFLVEVGQRLEVGEFADKVVSLIRDEDSREQKHMIRLLLDAMVRQDKQDKDSGDAALQGMSEGELEKELEKELRPVVEKVDVLQREQKRARHRRQTERKRSSRETVDARDADDEAEADSGDSRGTDGDQGLDGETV